jgi:hypothetical protein
MVPMAYPLSSKRHLIVDKRLFVLAQDQILLLAPCCWLSTSSLWMNYLMQISSIGVLEHPARVDMGPVIV